MTIVSINESLDHPHPSAESEDLDYGMWMYFPYLPDELQEAFDWLLSDPRPSRNQHFEQYKDPHIKQARRVLKETQKMVESLALPPIEDPQKALWKVEMLSLDWPETMDESLCATLPPFRYQVHITWTTFDLTEYELFLTPAHLRLITRLNEEIGRRIGDELDGPRPQV